MIQNNFDSIISRGHGQKLALLSICPNGYGYTVANGNTVANYILIASNELVFSTFKSKKITQPGTGKY